MLLNPDRVTMNYTMADVVRPKAQKHVLAPAKLQHTVPFSLISHALAVCIDCWTLAQCTDECLTCFEACA